MSDIRATRDVYSAVYGSSLALLVGEDCYNKLVPVLPQSADVFLMSKSGVICAAEPQKDQSTAPALPLYGMPIGIKAILVSGKTRQFADKLIEHARFHGANVMPALHEVAPFSLVSKQKAAAFIADVMADQASELQSHQGTTQKQIAQLRGRYERLWLSFEKARRMIKGVGYGLRNTALCLEPGEETIGPSPDTVLHHFQQTLPADLVGLTGISLYVAKSAVSGATGELVVRISRSADAELIGEQRIDYGALDKGWLTCSFDHAVAMKFGDGNLEIEWIGAGGPRLAVAETKTVRFGDTDARSLALQVEKGLVDPTVSMAPPVLSRRLSTSRKISISAMQETGQFLWGARGKGEAEKSLGDPVVTFDESGEWLQTHVVEGSFVGWRLPSFLGAKQSSMSVTGSLAHEQAPDCLFVLASAAKSMTEAELAEALSKLGGSTDGGMPSSGATGQIAWNSRVLSGGEKAAIDLELPDADGEPRDVILAVKSVGTKIDYGHARWSGLTIETPVEENTTLQPLWRELRHHGKKRQLQIRTHRLSEMGSQISFYQGTSKLTEITERLGFSPLITSEETGSLQTHPFDGEASAGIIHMASPYGATKLVSEIGTAHSAAPRFTYILAVIPTGRADRANTVATIVGKVKDGETMGYDPSEDVQWCSHTLEAMETHSLELTLATPSDRPSDVVMAAFGADGIDSYGWCRWYSLEVTTCLEQPVQHGLKRPNEDTQPAVQENG